MIGGYAHARSSIHCKTPANMVAAWTCANRSGCFLITPGRGAPLCARPSPQMSFVSAHKKGVLPQDSAEQTDRAIINPPDFVVPGQGT
ncbi:MAG: hypothetical protein R6W66_07730 [Pelovirga sp.]